jgi:hypothetical protein
VAPEPWWFGVVGSVMSCPSTPLTVIGAPAEAGKVALPTVTISRYNWNVAPVTGRFVVASSFCSASDDVGGTCLFVTVQDSGTPTAAGKETPRLVGVPAGAVDPAVPPTVQAAPPVAVAGRVRLAAGRSNERDVRLRECQLQPQPARMATIRSRAASAARVASTPGAT